MTSRDFCYWLQGFFEIGGQPTDGGPSLISSQVAAIRRHLALVFKHEIDPSYGDPAYQEQLRKIHNGPNEPQARQPSPYSGADIVFTC